MPPSKTTSPPAASIEVADDLKHEAISQLAMAAMEFFRAESEERYEEVAAVYVEQVIEDLCKRFRNENDSLREDFVSVEEAFCAVIDKYLDVAEAFHKLCPLEYQVGMMLKKVDAASSLIEVSEIIANSCAGLEPSEVHDVIGILEELQL